MQVVLSWTASVTSNVIFYRIYRSQFSGGPYQLIGTSNTDPLLGATTTLPLGTQFPAALTTYTDISAPNNQTAYYVISSVDTDYNESSYSSQYTATPPNQPNAPTGISSVIS